MGPASDPSAEWKPRFNPWLIAASVMLGTFMEVLDTSVANVALPHIAGSLSATPEEATWALTSYLISNAIILPAAGWLGNRFGRKRFLMTCILLFTLSSAFVGAATSLGMMILARVFQGVGGGALQPIAQAVLMESFPPAKRGVAMAVYSMGVIVAPILGPTVGGWITDNYSWRWVFYINLPVGALAFMMAQLFIEDPPYVRDAPHVRIDYVGFGLLTLWLATLQIMLDKGQEADWFSAAWVRWFLVISAASMVGFAIRELMTEEPIVNLRILTDRNFGTGTFLITILGFALYGTTAMLPLFLQTLIGYPALQSGLALSPRGLGAMCSAFAVGRLTGIIDNRFMIATGFTLLAGSAFMFSHMTLDIAMRNIVLTVLLNGISTGLIFVPLTTAAMGRLRNEQMGNATGIYNLLRNIGASVGISLMTTWLARGAQVHQVTLVSHLTPYDPAYQQRIQALQAELATRTNPVAASRQALGMVYSTLVQQATLLAFVDIFRRLSFMALACVPLVLLFRRVTARPAVPTH